MAFNMRMAARVDGHRKLFHLFCKATIEREMVNEVIKGKNGNPIKIGKESY